jgi:hypothetical protein
MTPLTKRHEELQAAISVQKTLNLTALGALFLVIYIWSNGGISNLTVFLGIFYLFVLSPVVAGYWLVLSERALVVEEQKNAEYWLVRLEQIRHEQKYSNFSESSSKQCRPDGDSGDGHKDFLHLILIAWLLGAFLIAGYFVGWAVFYLSGESSFIPLDLANLTEDSLKKAVALSLFGLLHIALFPLFFVGVVKKSIAAVWVNS